MMESKYWEIFFIIRKKGYDIFHTRLKSLHCLFVLKNSLILQLNSNEKHKEVLRCPKKLFVGHVDAYLQISI